MCPSETVPLAADSKGSAKNNYNVDRNFLLFKFNEKMLAASHKNVRIVNGTITDCVNI